MNGQESRKVYNNQEPGRTEIPHMFTPNETNLFMIKSFLKMVSQAIQSTESELKQMKLIYEKAEHECEVLETSIDTLKVELDFKLSEMIQKFESQKQETGELPSISHNLKKTLTHIEEQLSIAILNNLGPCSLSYKFMPKALPHELTAGKSTETDASSLAFKKLQEFVDAGKA